MSRDCFAAGTPVLTPDGAKPIEDCRPGDRILCRADDDPAGLVEAKTVERLVISTARVIALRAGRAVIPVTAQHLLWADNLRNWVPAGVLQPGDLLLRPDGKTVHFDSAGPAGELQTVYNLHVAENLTFFVGSGSWESAVWAHNCTCGL